jgi:hypothetical protein
MSDEPATCHPVGGAWYHPILTQDDTTHDGAIVARPVMRLWPQPFALVPCLQLGASSGGDGGLDHLSPMMARLSGWVQRSTSATVGSIVLFTVPHTPRR